VLAGAYGYQVQHRLKVANGSGTMKDWSSWVEMVDTDNNIDQQVDQLDVSIRRDFGSTLSLVPWRTDSTLNVLDDLVTYSPAIDAGRAITWEVATTVKGTAPVSGDWKLEFTGVIDTVNVEVSPMVVVARDLGGKLVDRWIETEVVEPAIGSLEAGIQRILDALFGGGVIPLNTPVSPGYALNAYKQQVEPSANAILALQQLIGWDTRYLWDNTSGTFKFTLWDVGRAKVIPDYTFGPSRVISVNKLQIDKQTVRNVIIVSYKDVASGIRSSVTVTDGTSIAKYDRQVLLDVEPDDSPINSNALATTIANVMLSDLKDPKAEQEVEMFLWWPAMLNDLYRFSPNGRHYNVNTDLAVVRVRHHFEMTKHRTTLTVRGKPTAGYNNWINRADPHGDPGTPNPRLQAYVTQGPTMDVWHEDVVFSVDGGDAPLTWRWRSINARTGAGAWSSFLANSGGNTLPVTKTIVRTPRWAQTIEFQFQDGAGRFSNIASYPIAAVDINSAGSATSLDQEDQTRGGSGGLNTPGNRFHTQPPYTSDGFTPMWNPVTAVMTASVKHPAGTAFDDAENRVITALENSGNLNTGVQQRNGTGLKNPAVGRYSLGTGTHASTITFPANYQNPPAVNILGGISYEPASVWGTAAQADAGGTGVLAPAAARQIDEVTAYNITTSGATLRARLRQASATTARSNAYAAGTITTTGGTLEATTANAPAANDTYTTDFSAQFQSTAVPGKACNVSADICLDWWNGSVWTQVASVTYSASDPVGGHADTGVINSTLVATVSGLTGTSKFRVRLSTNAGAGTRTYSVDPGNVTYTTTAGDQYATKTPAGLGINLSVEVIGAS
jgi:hypothetical protein